MELPRSNYGIGAPVTGRKEDLLEEEEARADSGNGWLSRGDRPRRESEDAAEQ